MAAIEAFELTLISMNSPFDKWVLQDQRPNEAAVRGFELFRSEKFGYSGCHQGLNFSSEEYFRTGVETPDRGLAKATKDEQDAFKYYQILGMCLNTMGRVQILTLVCRDSKSQRQN
jgi:cytochrome c peroxidase